MDCKVCNPETDDENICLQCDYEIAPMLEYLDKAAGGEVWCPIRFSRAYVRQIEAFIAGARLPFRATPIANDQGEWQLERLEKPLFDYVMPSEV